MNDIILFTFFTQPHFYSYIYCAGLHQTIDKYHNAIYEAK